MERRCGSVLGPLAGAVNSEKEDMRKEKERKREAEGKRALQQPRCTFVSVSDVMMLVDSLFRGTFKERTNMWFPLGRQRGKKRKKKVISGGKSNSEKEDKRDREEREERARGRENVEMRGVDLHWLDLTSVKLR